MPACRAPPSLTVGAPKNTHVANTIHNNNAAFRKSRDDEFFPSRRL